MVQPTLIIDEGLGAKPLQSKVMAGQIFQKKNHHFDAI